MAWRSSVNVINEDVRRPPQKMRVAFSESSMHDEEFRQAMRLFAASVSAITALDADGEPRGLTCSAVCSLSADPPSLLVCVNSGSRSLDAFRSSGGFVVNVLEESRRELSTRFASPSDDKFSLTEWKPSPISGLPLLIKDSLILMDCKLTAEVSAGSHTIMIGLVRGTCLGISGGPLLYWQQSYGAWTTGNEEKPEGATDYAALRQLPKTSPN